jgi:endoglucanase Acf2
MKEGIESSILSIGEGNCTTVLPPRAIGVQSKIYKTKQVSGKMPTNKWWSSLAWDRFSEAQYPHPLAIMAVPSGLRVYYPGNHILANETGIYGRMPRTGNRDLLITHSSIEEFPEALVDSFSDWLVTVAFEKHGIGMKLTYGHGSPYVYARCTGGGARLVFSEEPKVWHEAAGDSVLGITINGNHYGLFGPTGSCWKNSGAVEFINDLAGKDYFSLALLPEASVEALTRFSRFAHNHPVDTRVEWFYEERKSLVRTEYRFLFNQLEQGEEGTIFALYPHQWRNTDHPLLLDTYLSVRGLMKIGEGKGFSTEMKYHGILPVLPVTEEIDPVRLQSLLRIDKETMDRGSSDTYWTGKYLGKLATLAAIAMEAGFYSEAECFFKLVKKELEEWFTAIPANAARFKTEKVFYYNDQWGTLIGYPASYGSEIDLNDHHFHYGYFIRAAAQLGLATPEWTNHEKWGGMVNMLIRDIASPDREDPLFPFLRCFDVYAGHSWASGNARYEDGNNQESSSEALNAWAGIILWGMVSGNQKLRDLGIYLYTTEVYAVHEYWFDSLNQNFPKDYSPSVVTIVWGGKGANTTWWTDNPEEVHGINWLPFHGGSFYLGLYPEYVLENYQALLKENNGEDWDKWADLIWMWLALADPKEAIRQYTARAAEYLPEEGNSRTNVYHWLFTLKELGRVERSVVADTTLYGVFSKDEQRTYVAYNLSNSPQNVTFSDGYKILVAPKSIACERVDLAK